MSSSETTKPANAQQTSIFRRLPILGALVIVLSVNLLLVVFNPLQKTDPDNLPVGHGWAWWATNEFNKPVSKPGESFNIVVLGSSAMMHPVWLGEASFRNEDVDLVVDHRSKCLESAIKKYAPATNPVCFNFAMPGAMPSDDYAITKALFKGDKKPKIVIFGLHARDLMDNTFTCAASSRHYKYLSHFFDSESMLELALPDFWRRVVYKIEQVLYLRNKNRDMQVLASENTRSVLWPVLSVLPKSKLDAKEDEDRKLAIFVDELNKGVWIAHPTAPYNYIDASGDCKKRFKTPNNQLFANQTTWLKLCLETCNKEGITPLLVNMPTTAPVRAAMPAGCYDRHIAKLKELSATYNCPMLDLNRDECYVPRDFTDWMHMNGDGGKKLLSLIGEFIGKNSQLASTISNTNTQLAAKAKPTM